MGRADAAGGPAARLREVEVIRRTVRVANEEGLHARPCHAVVATALRFRSDLRIRKGEREVNGKSILELMTLDACHGTELELLARGEDASVLVGEIAGLFEAGFGETLAD